MTDGPLSPSQVDDFVDFGWTILRGAFPAVVAAAVRAALEVDLGIGLHDGATSSEPMVWLQDVRTGPPFIDALTPRFVAAVDQLVGAGRWRLEPLMGWFPITFPGFAKGADNWHVEGNFQHHVWSPEQAILNLFCFSTVEAGGGGTRLIEGSHADVARLLWEAEPDGLHADDIWPVMNKILDERDWAGEVSVVADEGDVVLAHPLIFHASTPNAGTRPRVMAQPRFDMVEPKRVSGPGLCPVEISIASARP